MAYPIKTRREEISEAMERGAAVTSTTCQICSRAIRTRTRLSRRDLIVTHGYRQPWLRDGDGNRITPCEGSGQLPYEVSRDAIPSAMDARRAARDRAEAERDSLLADPPASFHVVRRNAYGAVRFETNVDRPAGFDPRASRTSHHPRQLYEIEFDLRVRELNGLIVGLSTDHEFLRQRHESWRAPARAA